MLIFVSPDITHLFNALVFFGLVAGTVGFALTTRW